MPKYYVIEASYGPRIDQNGLRSGELDSEKEIEAIHKLRTEFETYMHQRIEVFASEKDYQAREPPLSMWEDSESLARLVHNEVTGEVTRRKFEAFFVNPLPG